VAVSVSSGIVHFPSTVLPGFGAPNPEGLAVGHVDATGDLSGGLTSMSLLADGGFLYRLELFNATRDNADADQASLITSHRWATDKSGLGVSAFDLNWILENVSSSQQVFGNQKLQLNDYQMIRRFPLGRTDAVAAQFIMTFLADNVDATVYDIDAVFSYWPKTAMFRAGFLQSFNEFPGVSPVSTASVRSEVIRSVREG